MLSSSSRTSEEVHYHYVRFGGEDASTLDKVRSSSFGPLCFYWSFSSDDANEIYCVPYHTSATELRPWTGLREALPMWGSKPRPLLVQVDRLTLDHWHPIYCHTGHLVCIQSCTCIPSCTCSGAWPLGQMVGGVLGILDWRLQWHSGYLVCCHGTNHRWPSSVVGSGAGSWVGGV